MFSKKRVSIKIVDGIYQVDGVNCNVYLVEEGDKLVLIDMDYSEMTRK